MVVYLSLPLDHPGRNLIIRDVDKLVISLFTINSGKSKKSQIIIQRWAHEIDSRSVTNECFCFTSEKKINFS